MIVFDVSLMNDDGSIHLFIFKLIIFLKNFFQTKWFVIILKRYCY